GPPRARAKPPGTVRFLVLGGNAPEGFGVAQDVTMARFLEQYADERRGRRLEVLNGATGGWALDQSLAFFRGQGAGRSPDLVLLMLDPVNDLVGISPAQLAALGRRVPVKPYMSLVDGRAVPAPPFTSRPAPPQETPGVLAHVQLWRLLRRLPLHVGDPMAWADAPAPPHGTLEQEREHSVDLVRALLEALRDDVAAAGGRLVVVIAPLPGATGPEATGRWEREKLTAVAEEAGIPLLDLTNALANVTRWGLPLHLQGSVRLTGPAHALAAAQIWGFLQEQGLLPEGLVPARVPTGGRAIPALDALPGALVEALWQSR